MNELQADDIIVDDIIRGIVEGSYDETRRSLTSLKAQQFIDTLHEGLQEDIQLEILLRAIPPIRENRIQLEELAVVERHEYHTGREVIDYALSRFGPPLETIVGGKTNLVSVFIPTRNSGHRIVENMGILIADLDNMPEDTTYELIICINDSQDDTTGRIVQLLEKHINISATIIEFEGNQEKSKKLPTNVSYELLLEQDSMLQRVNPKLKRFIHFHDDDITFHSYQESSVFANIEELLRHPKLLLTSGIYSVSSASGFGLISSSRKNVGVLRQVKQPPIQIYGGAATTHYAAFPRGGIPDNAKGFDAYMSTYLLQGQRLEEIPSLPSRANPSLFVEHPEEQSVYRFAARLVRDSEYKHALLTNFPSRDIKKFYRMRKQGFNMIQDIIMGLEGDNELRICFMLYDRFRSRVEQEYQQGRLDLNHLRRLQPNVDSNTHIKEEYERRIVKI
ncbi:MAG: hypothetical protein Q8R37_00520 [Nanoarchaeota archaeon]|nr:hypothetical protein [Nanoarchaeota archaeon]